MEGTKLYVGNIAYKTTSKDLIDFFSQYGHVLEAMIIVHKITQRSKGFGFVTFASSEEAQAALIANGTEYEGRKLVVQLAKPDPAPGQEEAPVEEQTLEKPAESTDIYNAS